eukprot:TRINITY_DN97_c0_g1_i1.p1 TRINITY_DN97_c0_g1~~TRINITY_DN97_c0_g1_i1.p1  ORF type:complete len:210 (-),score=77.94 TRINITY_DN97_c0_g1_i1:107-685(-)
MNVHSLLTILLLGLAMATVVSAGTDGTDYDFSDFSEYSVDLSNYKSVDVSNYESVDVSNYESVDVSDFDSVDISNYDSAFSDYSVDLSNYDVSEVSNVDISNYDSVLSNYGVDLSNYDVSNYDLSDILDLDRREVASAKVEGVAATTLPFSAGFTLIATLLVTATIAVLAVAFIVHRVYKKKTTTEAYVTVV